MDELNDLWEIGDLLGIRREPSIYEQRRALKDAIKDLKGRMEHQHGEVLHLKTWVGDLLSGMYINCVYCGHRYPPGTPDVQDRALYDHIMECPKHPVSKLSKERDELVAICGTAAEQLQEIDSELVDIGIASGIDSVVEDLEDAVASTEGDTDG